MSENPIDELEAMKAALDALSPLDEEARQRALAWIAGALGVEASTVDRSPGLGTVLQNASPGDLGTPKQFLATKAPQSDIERVTCLAYYLTHARSTQHFETSDLSALNTEAAAVRLSNASYAASNAQKKNGYLAPAPGGKKQITHRGEVLVEALPDRAAARAAVEAIPGPRRSAGGRKRPAAKDAE